MKEFIKLEVCGGTPDPRPRGCAQSLSALMIDEDMGRKLEWEKKSAQSRPQVLEVAPKGGQGRPPADWKPSTRIY